MEVVLTKGFVATVDDSDFSVVSNYTWFVVESDCGPQKYAGRSEMVEGKKTTILMHRQLVDAKRGEVVDHRDGDGLNNRRTNIRACSHRQNIQHRTRLNRNNVHMAKGVFLDRRRGKWRAMIMADGRRHCLGSHATKQQAADAYDKAALSLHGEFATLNTQFCNGSFIGQSR